MIVLLLAPRALLHKRRVRNYSCKAILRELQLFKLVGLLGVCWATLSGFVRVSKNDFVRASEDNFARVSEDNYVRVSKDNLVSHVRLMTRQSWCLFYKYLWRLN